MRTAITATEGWSSSQVNQDSRWDMPTSPEPTDKEPAGSVVAWKLPGVNNGLEVWQMSSRNGGAPPVKPAEAQWPHHIPQSNIGGTWGEDDDSQQQQQQPGGGGMWTGAPAGPPTGQQWGGATGGGGNGGGGGGNGGGGGALWAPGGRKDDWGGAPKPWDARGAAPNGDGWGSKPPSQWGGPPQHAPGGHGQWGGGDDRSPPMARRSMAFDDWGNKRGGPGGGGPGGGWKDAGPVRPGMPGGPPAPPQMLSRMPPDHVKPGGDPWGRPPRNGGWGEAAVPGGPAGWGGEEKWGGPEGPAGWGKPKTPTTPVMPGAWGGDPEMDWAAKGRGPAGGVGHPKNAMYDKARLTEHGFKPEDVDPMMRNNMGLSLEDAVDQLRMGGGGPGGPGGPGGDWRAPDHPPFEPAGFSQMPPPHAPYGGVQMPAAGAPGAGNINPAVIQQLLRQQAQGAQPSRFPGQPQPQPSPQQLRPLINQIQMAVHAGHLNPAILQQPMAPQTLLLLNHLLSQIKHLDQLSRQAHLARGHPSNSPHVHNLQMEIMRVKNNISNIQAQISSQQTMLLKQQQPPAPPQPMAAGGGGPLLYKGPGGGHGGHDLHGLPANLGELSLRDAGIAAGGGHMPQSRLSQWKLPTADKLLRGDEDFSRAPGSASKAGGSPPMMALMADSAWSASRGGRDGGWPDGGGRGGGGPVAPAADRQESKDGWPESGGAAGGHNYADLVPEFEPGKPWKMKSPDDDPALTPGAAARSPLGMPGGGGQDMLAMQTGKASSPTTSSPADSFGSSTWSFNPNGGKPGMAAGGGGGGADWGVKSRGPPPGLNKAGGGWGGGGGQGGGGAALSRPGAPQYDQRSAFAQVQGGGYGGGGGGSAWLLLRNLTPQIDGSTLKTLCMQHGPLYTFHMYLNQGVALVKYSSREEAAKAQGALNNCVLSNTTILAEAVSDETAGQVLQQLGLPGGGQQGAGNPASSGAAQQAGAGGHVQTAPKPPTSAAWSDMTDAMGGGGGSSMAWSSASGGGNSSLWAAPGGLEEPGRGPYLPDGLL